MSALAPIIGLVLAISVLLHIAGRAGGPLVAPILLPELYDEDARSLLRRSFELDDASARTVRRALFAAQVIERRPASEDDRPTAELLRDRARLLAGAPDPALRVELEDLIKAAIPRRG